MQGYTDGEQELNMITHEVKDTSIQMIRIISMIFIIVCHLAQETKIPVIVDSAQFFNVGVYVFLLVSGYLYGNKKVKNKRDFYIGRISKILLPMWIFCVILFAIHMILGNDVLLAIPAYLTNTQYWLGGIGGGQHLWFVSVIGLCYLFVPYLDKIKKNIIAFILVGLLGCFVNHKAGMTILYASVFVLGALYREHEDCLNIDCKKYILIIFASVAVRVLARELLDGTVLYDCVVVYMTHTLLAFGIFGIGKQIKIKPNRCLDWLDHISYYVYLVHYMYIVGPVSFIGITSVFSLNILIVVAISFVTAYMLSVIHLFVLNFIGCLHCLVSDLSYFIKK